jgi:hypothetical protein
MKLRNQLLKYNLQYFADNNGNAGQGEADNSGDDDGDDDQDEGQDDNGTDDKSKKSDKKGKYLTQDEINQIIEERLNRERKKLQKKQEQSKDDKQSDKGSDEQSKDDTNAKKLSDLEMKVLCYDHDIAKEYVKEAIALAKAYVDEDTDLDEALDMVTKKFPQFVKGASKTKDDAGDGEDDDNNNKAWGQRQKGQTKKIDPVEARFLERNPGLKID